MLDSAGKDQHFALYALRQATEDVQNQILPMLGLQPSEELKNEATINAVGKLSQAADHASNLLSAAEQTDQSAAPMGARGQ